ncbi:hypothetical protein PGN61_23120 [Klebsiella aerogenes]
MAANSSRGKVTGTVTVYIRGDKAFSRKVSRRSIAQSAMNNAKTGWTQDDSYLNRRSGRAEREDMGVMHMKDSS